MLRSPQKFSVLSDNICFLAIILTLKKSVCKRNTLSLSQKLCIFLHKLFPDKHGILPKNIVLACKNKALSQGTLHSLTKHLFIFKNLAFPQETFNFLAKVWSFMKHLHLHTEILNWPEKRCILSHKTFALVCRNLCAVSQNISIFSQKCCFQEALCSPKRLCVWSEKFALPRETSHSLTEILLFLQKNRHL